jgi:hypothetical protein
MDERNETAEGFSALAVGAGNPQDGSESQSIE